MSKLVLLEDVLQMLKHRRYELSQQAQRIHCDMERSVVSFNNEGLKFMQRQVSRAYDEVQLLINRTEVIRTMGELIDYTCSVCHKIRQAPLIDQDDMTAWYLCFCSSGKTGPGVRMTCPEDKRDPGPLAVKKKPGRKSKIKKEPFVLQKDKVFGVLTPDMN